MQHHPNTISKWIFHRWNLFSQKWYSTLQKLNSILQWQLASGANKIYAISVKYTKKLNYKCILGLK